MDNQLPHSTEGKPQTPPLRRLPAWAWVLAAVSFPEGMFVALAVTRAMRWRSAVPAAVLSAAIRILYIEGLRVSMRNPSSPITSSMITLGLFFYAGAIGLLQYCIGLERGLWGQRARRYWRIAGGFLLFFVVLDALSIAMMLLMYHHRDRVIELVRILCGLFG